MMGKTYYSGERVCGTNMAPQKVVKINGAKLPKDEVFQLMNDAFDGKIEVLQVSFGKVKWLCTRGWSSGIIWWKIDGAGRTFSATNEGWTEILTNSAELRGEGKIN